MGKKCPTYDKCFYQMARRRMENGDLLVCNHALFFANLLRWQQTQGPPNGRIRTANVIDNALSPPMRELCNHLRLLRAKAAKEPDEFELNSYAQRADEIAAHAEALLEQKIEGCVY